jgi:hypothetical protein
MCDQDLLGVSQPSECCLVPLFKNQVSVRNFSVHMLLLPNTTITEQNMIVTILESSDLSKPEEMIMNKTVVNSV